MTVDPPSAGTGFSSGSNNSNNVGCKYGAAEQLLPLHLTRSNPENIPASYMLAFDDEDDDGDEGGPRAEELRPTAEHRIRSSKLSRAPSGDAGPERDPLSARSGKRICDEHSGDLLSKKPRALGLAVAKMGDGSVLDDGSGVWEPSASAPEPARPRPSVLGGGVGGIRPFLHDYEPPLIPEDGTALDSGSEPESSVSDETNDDEDMSEAEAEADTYFKYIDEEEEEVAGDAVLPSRAAATATTVALPLAMRHRPSSLQLMNAYSDGILNRRLNCFMEDMSRSPTRLRSFFALGQREHGEQVRPGHPPVPLYDPRDPAEALAADQRFELLLGASFLAKKPRGNGTLPEVCKVDAGEDAYFASRNKGDGWTIGMADGVGGWVELAVDPSIFAWTLMECAEAISRDTARPDPAALMEDAYKRVVDDAKVTAGSSTAFVGVFDRTEGTFDTANLGDSGYLILRPTLMAAASSSARTGTQAFGSSCLLPVHQRSTANSPLLLPNINVMSFLSPAPRDGARGFDVAMSGVDVARDNGHDSCSEGNARELRRVAYGTQYKSVDSQHYFNAPFQLAIIPESLAASPVRSLGDRPSDAARSSHQLQEGDLVIVATDGLWDNMFVDEITAKAEEAVQAAVHDTRPRKGEGSQPSLSASSSPLPPPSLPADSSGDEADSAPGTPPDHDIAHAPSSVAQETRKPRVKLRISTDLRGGERSEVLRHLPNTATEAHRSQIHSAMQSLAETLVHDAKVASRQHMKMSPFSKGAKEAAKHHMGGKVDDITVLVAYVMEYKNL